MIRKVLAFLAISASAYALSFSVDMLLGAIFHYYPPTFYIPVAIWLVIACITGFLALILWPGHSSLSIPSAVLAIVALIGGIVGHRFNFGVSAIMFVQSYFIWFCTRIQAGSAASQ